MTTPAAAPPPAQKATSIRTDKVSRRFGTTWAVQNVSLDVPQGELFGLLGPNGAGKTTLFSMLSTQLKPTSGDMWVQGIDVRKDPKRVRQAIGIVPQAVAAYEKLTSWENLHLFANLYGIEGTKADRRAEELLRMVGLQERANEVVGNFSGGMKHRLNIILGLIHDPRVIFFDEPTTGLDPIARRSLWKVIRMLHRTGKTIVLTTHYMQEAEELCDRVAILNRGRIVALGNPKKMGKSLEETFFQCTTADDPNVGVGRK